MLNKDLSRWAALILLMPVLACAVARQTPLPAPTVDPLAFEIQTATPTIAPMFDMSAAAGDTPAPDVTPALTTTVTATLTATLTLTPAATATPPAAATRPAPAAPPPTATIPPAEPLQGGVWDFEEGFTPWRNPHGDSCPGSGLANGWMAFTTRDQYGSACMNETVWKDNVYSGVSAQEITFAYVGIEAGIFRSAPSIPGHRYTIEAFMRREFSPAKVEVSLGVDVTGGVDWQAESVRWFPWNEDPDDEWARTEVTVTAAGESMTIFIKGSHPYPEPGGALRLDSIRIVDEGPE